MLCFAFHQRKAPFCPLQKTSQNTLEIPTLKLEKGVDSSTDSSHRLSTYCLAKFWVAPTTCLQNCPWIQLRRHLFQDSFQKTPGPSLCPTQASNTSPSALASPRVLMCPWASHRAGNTDSQCHAVKSLLRYSTCSIRDTGK